MSENRQNKPAVLPREQVMEKLDDVLSGIRVPDLPYPVGKPSEDAVSDWKPVLGSCWTEQRDERVIQLIQSVSLTWSVRQINSAYVADRIMDVFLKTSGLHPELARRVARLRFFLAWRMNEAGEDAFTGVLLRWLDGLQEWRGWSDSGGRSARVLLDQLSSLVISVSACFESTTCEPLNAFCREWQEDSAKRTQQVTRLRNRLLVTEQGAARQRCADQTARALVGRALTGRKLPQAVVTFIFDHWLPLLKQVVWAGELDADNGRHGRKLLEWLVWLGDPSLSDRDRNRLYHVGEQIGDRILDVWHRVHGKPLPASILEGIQSVLMARLRGETPELKSALPEPSKFSWDASWLSLSTPPTETYQALERQWFAEGEGKQEQRSYFFALLPETAEILWTNGAGVKLGLQSWDEFAQAREAGSIRPLPALTSFGKVLTDTVAALDKVLTRQKALRQEAALEARAKAKALRRQKTAADQQRQAEEAQQRAELETREQQARDQREADDKMEQERLDQEERLAVYKVVDGIKLGGWIVLATADDQVDPVRLKLAVRINASNKLIFVDRLGLNRREFLGDQLAEQVLAGNVRVLGSAAEFDDTLSRVVGRIRVGRN
ncbi:DUF1631 family protein [Marinobacter sp.]|uniref:DUF1631 family protein n=1 Tax=Marinobacter sp. TaxID=50741 RepID=UPI0034A2C05B